MTSPPRIDWRFATLCAAFLTVLFAVQQWIAPPAARPDLGFGTALVLQGTTWALWLALLPLIIGAGRRWPLNGRPTPAWLLGHLALAAAFAVGHGMLSGAVRWSAGVALASDLGVAMANNVVTSFPNNVLRYGAILLAYQAVLYHHAVRERERREASLELDLARATLQNLQGRLRPHFLFNALNTIAALVREDPSSAEKMIGQLSDLLRASLQTDPLLEVRLDDELRLVHQYLNIERVRFRDRLRISIVASDETRQALVPNLMLQPLVENAVRHGIAPLESGGSIAVCATRADGRLVITVSDDGVGVAGSSIRGSGIGLGGLRQRLEHIYGSAHRVDVSPWLPRGTLVTVEIPFLRSSR